MRIPSSRGPHPVAVVIHGGFWRAAYSLDHIGHLCEGLRQAGLATWSLEYRRIGDPGGGYPGTLDDVRAGAAHLVAMASEYRLDLKRAIVTGHSAGGHLALWLGKQKPQAWRGIVPLAPVADLRRAYELRLSNLVVGDLLGGSPDEQAERYRAASPAEFAPLGVPTHILHGTRDTIVPLELSETYVARAGREAKLIRLDGAGHFELIDPRTAYWSTVRDTILELL